MSWIMLFYILIEVLVGVVIEVQDSVEMYQIFYLCYYFDEDNWFWSVIICLFLLYLQVEEGDEDLYCVLLLLLVFINILCIWEVEISFDVDFVDLGYEDFEVFVLGVMEVWELLWLVV